MSYVEFRDAELAYGAGPAVLEHVTLRLARGWVGVVGANGHGKSTLLAAIAGAPLVRGGVLDVDGGVVELCTQRVDTLERRVSEFALRDDSDARRLMSRFDLDPEVLRRWTTLSPGEARRWQLAAAIAHAPDVLLVDEPTNHLDTYARDLVIEPLQQFRGVGIVVSHDQALLERLTTQTVRVHRGAAHLYAGAYSTARGQWTADETAQANARGGLQQRIYRQQRSVSAAAHAASSAEASKSTRKRMRSKYDSDARTLAAGQLADWAAGKASRQVGIERRELERLEAQLGPGSKDPTIGALIAILHAPAPKRFVAQHDGVTLERATRLHIRGANGAGKSTLARALVDTAQLPPERLLYLPQELTREEIAAEMEAVRALPRDRRGELLSVVAALGLDPDVLLASGDPSPGEARKLVLARGLLKQPWLVVLDEPTNHLDLPTSEKLAEALRSYPGALVIITHDDALAEACRCDTVLQLPRSPGTPI